MSHVFFAVLFFFGAGVVAAPSERFLESLATGRLEKVDFSQKPAVLTFVQPGCGPCKKQLKQLDCLYTEASNKAVVLGIQASGDSEELKRGLAPLRLALPILKGTPDFLALYGADTEPTPMTVVLEAGGKLRTRVFGPRPCAFWKQALGKEGGQ